MCARGADEGSSCLFADYSQVARCHLDHTFGYLCKSFLCALHFVFYFFCFSVRASCQIGLMALMRIRAAASRLTSKVIIQAISGCSCQAIFQKILASYIRLQLVECSNANANVNAKHLEVFVANLPKVNKRNAFRFSFKVNFQCCLALNNYFLNTLCCLVVC